MLTKRQNVLETIHGGNPDRYVNQFEAFKMAMGSPMSKLNPRLKKGDMLVKNAWGVYKSFPENVPGAFPVHDAEHVVIKDITRWREYVTIPPTKFSDEEWAPFEKRAAEIDTNEYFRTCLVGPGIFEQCHYLMEMQNCLLNFYMEPECMHEIVDMLTEWELSWAEELCKHIHPTAILHHDDWGSRTSSFLSPEMFAEYFLEPYKKIYGYYHSHGVELIVHHSDSYGANLLPYMVEMGIDIWQGCMRANNIPKMIKEWGGKISFMCGIDNQDIDDPNWNGERVRAVVEQAIREGSRHYFIPCMAAGGAMSTYPGVYEAVSKEIARINSEL